MSEFLILALYPQDSSAGCRLDCVYKVVCLLGLSYSELLYLSLSHLLWMIYFRRHRLSYYLPMLIPIDELLFLHYLDDVSMSSDEGLKSLLYPFFLDSHEAFVKLAVFFSYLSSKIAFHNGSLGINRV